MIRFFQILVLPFLLASAPAKKSSAQTVDHGTDSLQVAHTITEFIDAFSNLQWERFSSFFSDDATAFFPPSANYPFRANNKIEIQKIFKAFFDTVKARKSLPPYLTIIPHDLRIQIFNSIAVATFTLDDPGLFGRRTVIWEKQKDNWVIVHLHASGVATQK